MQQLKNDIPALFAEMEKIKSEEFKPSLTGIEAMKDAFTRVKEAWSDLMTTLGQSNIAGLLGAALGGILTLIQGLIRGLDLVVGTIDKVITGLRILAGLAVAGLGKLFGMSAEDAKKLQDAISGVTSEGKQLGTTMEGISGQMRGLGTSSQAIAELRQRWKDGVISAHEYGEKVKEIYALKPATDIGELRQLWKDGIISASEYEKKLKEIFDKRPPTYAELRQMWKDGIIGIDEYKKRLAELDKAGPKEKVKDQFPDAKKGAEEYKKKVEEVKRATEQAITPKISWDAVTAEAEKAGQKIKAIFQAIDLKDFDQGA